MFTSHLIIFFKPRFPCRPCFLNPSSKQCLAYSDFYCIYKSINLQRNILQAIKWQSLMHATGHIYRTRQHPMLMIHSIISNLPLGLELKPLDLELRPWGKSAFSKTFFPLNLIFLHSAIWLWPFSLLCNYFARNLQDRLLDFAISIYFLTAKRAKVVPRLSWCAGESTRCEKNQDSSWQAED